MKKLVFLLVAFVTMSVSSFAQDKAKAYLDNIATKFKAHENVYVEFLHINNDANVESRGNATIQKDKYNVNILGVNRIFDGTKIYSIIHEDEEVVIETPSAEDEKSLSPAEMFTFYKQGYNFKMGSVKNENGRAIQYVTVTPIDSNSDVDKIDLGIDVKTNNIYKAIETGKNGIVTTLIVTKFKKNQPISDNLFQFDKTKFEDKGYDITEVK